jgi:hypothetical protein
MKPLSNYEINKYYKGDRRYGGTVARDTIHLEERKYGDLKDIKKFWIVNMDLSTGPGTHWVLVSFLNPDVAIYFDPFSVDPPTEILKFMRKWRPEVAMNEDIIQDVDSTNCGYFCVHVGNELSKGRLFMDIMTRDFAPKVKENENMITQQFQTYNFG